MTHKTADPKLDKMLADLDRYSRLCQRLYGRLKRTFNALDRASKKGARLGRRIQKLQQE